MNLEYRRQGIGRLDRLLVFVLAPLYGLMQLLVLVPLRFYALLTLREARWGTRESVEVRL